MRVKAAQDCGDAHGKRTAATVRAPEHYSNTSWFVFSICIFFFLSFTQMYNSNYVIKVKKHEKNNEKQRRIAYVSLKAKDLFVMCNIQYITE